MPINQNTALFSLLGVLYGGDGRTTFGLPDLRGRVPVHPDAATPQATRGGVETVRLSEQNIPPHGHSVLGSRDDAVDDNPRDNVFATRVVGNLYRDPIDVLDLAPDSVGPVLPATPHDNMQPYLVMRYVIALQGLFPTRS